MDIYKQKYEKYKFKYIELKNKMRVLNQNGRGDKYSMGVINDEITTEHKLNLLNNKTSVYKVNNSYKPNIDTNKKKFTEETLIVEGQSDKIKQLNDKISVYKVENNETVIDINLAEKIINGSIHFHIDDDKILNLDIETEIFHSMNIRNNTLSLPGITILLVDKFEDEWNVGEIHKLLNNKIIGKHTLFMPYQTEIKGILLENLIKILDLNDINTNKFIVNVEIKGNEILEKIIEENNNSTYGTINTTIKDTDYKDLFNDYNDYIDYVDINEYYI